MQRGDFIVAAMNDSKRKGGSENLERRPEKSLRMEDAPVVIVYDTRTYRTNLRLDAGPPKVSVHI